MQLSVKYKFMIHSYLFKKKYLHIKNGVAFPFIDRVYVKVAFLLLRSMTVFFRDTDLSDVQVHHKLEH